MPKLRPKNRFQTHLLLSLTIIPTFLIGVTMNANARATAPQITTPQNITQSVTEGFVDNNGLKIHYATLGKGPLVVLIHGHPDFWYGWRNQMPVLAQKYQVVAIDQRGINLSDQPKGIENYTIQNQVSDVVAVLKAFKHDKAFVVGHDTGAAIAWAVATALPQMIQGVISLNLPHPVALAKARASDPAQQAASRTSYGLAQPGSAAAITKDQLLAIVNPSNAADRSAYTEAFAHTNLETFVAYFQANLGPTATPVTNLPKLKVPALVIHGMKDPFIVSASHDRNWEYTDNTLTTVMIPKAGHFVQIDAAAEVTSTIMNWLAH
jgi:epoxide hydrolase 4